MKLCRTGSEGVSYLLRGALWFAILIYATHAPAQQPAANTQGATASVGGKVTAAAGQKTTNNLAGITVKLTATPPGSAPKTTITDFKGSYQFTNLTPGS